jgi:plastocyanin
VSGRAFLAGAIAALAVGAVVAVLVVASGVVPVAATRKGGLQDKILGYASTRSIAHHARDERNPLAGDPAALRRGLEHYRAMCVACHGGPGAAPEEFAAGLHPSAPDLASPPVQAFTDGMLYETVAGGIGSTGMPAFGPSHSREDLWSIVAFVRHLPSLTAEEKKALSARPERGEAGEAEGRARAQAAGTGNAAPTGKVHEVSITNFKFQPETLEVHAGDTVEWKNADITAHTATADDRKTFDTGMIDGNASKKVVVKQKGRFPYFCRYHSGMKGVLVVE